MLKRPEWNDGRVNLRALQAKRNQPFDDRGRELPFDDAKHLRLGRRRPLAEPIAYLHIGGVHPESLNYIMPYPLRQNVPQWGGPPGLRGVSRTRSAASHRLRPPPAHFRPPPPRPLPFVRRSRFFATGSASTSPSAAPAAAVATCTGFFSSAKLRFSASMMSITGAKCGSGVSTTFCPSFFASIIAIRLSR